uniref:Uncharacterized protein n=1 Tax=Hucho hucho TaxID=62062 RepID=A0A4W5R3T7_9TELE
KHKFNHKDQGGFPMPRKEGPADFPSQGLVHPSLENVCCTSLKSAVAALCNELAPELGHHPEETVSAVPGKVCTLLELLSTLQVKDSPANIFECQLAAHNWPSVVVNKNLFLTDLGVPGTAGRD